MEKCQMGRDGSRMKWNKTSDTKVLTRNSYGLKEHAGVGHTQNIICRKEVDFVIEHSLGRNKLHWYVGYVQGS